MRYLGLLWTNLMRRKTRTVLTLLSVITAFLLYGLLAAINNAFTGGVDLAGVDRLMVINKASFLQPLPLSYGSRIAAVEGVRHVSHATWVETYYQEPKNYVVTLAIDAESYLPMYREIVIPDAEKERWLKNPSGAAVGKALAKRFNWNVGDRITLFSSAVGEDGGKGWEFNIDAIVDIAESGGDTGMLLIHYRYFNEGRLIDRDTVWSYAVSLDEPSEAGSVAKRIDQVFENSAAETKTWTEKAIVQIMVAQFGNIGAIILTISTTMFFTMLLVTGSTISESVQERRSELALFKALGFTHQQVLSMILAESVLLVSLGGAIGLALAYLVNSSLSVILAQYLPLYGMKLSDLMVGFGLTVLLGLLAGLLPAQTGFRLPIALTLKAE